MRLKYCILWLFLIAFQLLSAQTYITPYVGINKHDFPIQIDKTDLIIGVDNHLNKVDYEVGASLQYFINPQWFVDLSAGYGWKRHGYSIYTLGIIHKHDHTYKLASLALTTGGKLWRSLLVGGGVNKVFFYNRKTQWNDGSEESRVSTAGTAFVAYNWNRLTVRVAYSETFQPKLKLLSLRMGYSFMVLKKHKKNNKLNCPKF